MNEMHESLEQAGFEDWARRSGINLARDPQGVYFSAWTQEMFGAWLALSGALRMWGRGEPCNPSRRNP